MSARGFAGELIESAVQTARDEAGERDGEFLVAQGRFARERVALGRGLQFLQKRQLCRSRTGEAYPETGDIEQSG